MAERMLGLAIARATAMPITTTHVKHVTSATLTFTCRIDMDHLDVAGYRSHWPNIVPVLCS